MHSWRRDAVNGKFARILENVKREEFKSWCNADLRRQRKVYPSHLNILTKEWCYLLGKMRQISSIRIAKELRAIERLKHGMPEGRGNR